MKKLLLSAVALFAVTALAIGQGEVLFTDFTGSLDTEKFSADDYVTADPARNQSILSIEDNQLKAEYTWDKPDWFPRALWYSFGEYLDCSTSDVLEVKFMIEDNDNETIPVRFDLYGDSETEINGAIQDTVETNANPWELEPTNGEWYTEGSDFSEDGRWVCSYWNGAIDPTSVDSTRIAGFQAFTNYGDNTRANQPGILWIDYIKLTDVMTGEEKYLVGGENAYGLAMYPTPVSEQLRFNSENTVRSIEFFDLSGRSVKRVNDINRKKFEINVSELPQGLYISNVYDSEGTMVSRKFIKE